MSDRDLIAIGFVADDAGRLYAPADSRVKLAPIGNFYECAIHQAARPFSRKRIPLTGIIRTSSGRQSRDAGGPKVSLVCIDCRSERVDSVCRMEFNFISGMHSRQAEPTIPRKPF